jgi:hypothetical protein
MDKQSEMDMEERLSIWQAMRMAQGKPDRALPKITKSHILLLLALSAINNGSASAQTPLDQIGMAKLSYCVSRGAKHCAPRKHVRVVPKWVMQISAP